MSSKIIKEYPTQSLITQCPELSFIDQFLKKVLDLDLLKSLKSSLQDYQNASFANARSMFEIIKLEEVPKKIPCVGQNIVKFGAEWHNQQIPG